MSWAGSRPVPLRTENLNTLDTLGRSRPMVLWRWAWLIGMSDESDGRLRDRARTFAAPPSIEPLRGGRLAFDSYVPERRAIRLFAEGREVAFRIKPGPPCVNLAFEIEGVSEREVRVALEANRSTPTIRLGRPDPLARCDDPAPTELRVRFEGPSVGR